MTTDKQLRDIRLADVLEKRRLDQALNAKEFAVLAGVSYSTAREWFRLPGFPAFRGVIFWLDFVAWRTGQASRPPELPRPRGNVAGSASLPPRAAKFCRRRDAPNVQPAGCHASGFFVQPRK
jgi:hypothetical protein